MFVHIGNDHAIEGYRDPTSDDPDLVRYRPVEGERVTEIIFADGMGLSESFTTVLAVMEHHMAAGTVPPWVDSDSPGLAALMQEHWALDDSATTRPPTWGVDTGAPEFLSDEPTTEEN